MNRSMVLFAELVICIYVQCHVIPSDLLALELFEHLRAV